VYDLKVAILSEVERLSEQGDIDLVYMDAARVSASAVVPYGWQFSDEDVFMPSTPGVGINCWALLTRNNVCRFQTTRASITSQFVLEQVEQLSLGLQKLTVLVLDNAPVHTARSIKARRMAWEHRGLFLLYLPRYAPHLNIVETLWRKLKYEWLTPKDYETPDGLFYTVRQALAAVGTSLSIIFSPFRLA
jgi:transposase